MPQTATFFQSRRALPTTPSFRQIGKAISSATTRTRIKAQITPTSSATGAAIVKTPPQIKAATAAFKAPLDCPSSLVPIAASTTPNTAIGNSSRIRVSNDSPSRIAKTAATAPSQAIVGATIVSLPVLNALKATM